MIASPRLSFPIMASLPVALLAVALAGCGADDGAAPDRGDVAASLPQPQPQPSGAPVTDMPAEPGPGQVPLAGEAPPAPPVLLPADDRFGLPPLEDNPEAGLAEAADPDPAPAEPTPADAAAVVRDYYAAIAARDFVRAHAAWSDGGRANGQTPEQFAAGFADTVRVEVRVGEPGPVDAGAGSRYVEVPVGVSAVHADGSVHRYTGRYTLRRAVVDGATEEQRAWRIASADLQEVAQ